MLTTQMAILSTFLVKLSLQSQTHQMQQHGLTMKAMLRMHPMKFQLLLTSIPIVNAITGCGPTSMCISMGRKSTLPLEPII